MKSTCKLNTVKAPRTPGVFSVLLRAGGLGLTLALAGCGTISDLRTADGQSKMDLAHFTKVVVRDFEDKASAQEEPAKREEKQSQLKRATRDFADLVASELKKTGAFEAVSREGTNDGSALLIGGAITKYERGSTAARLWVGMGAGSSYLDALVEVREGSTGTLLGSILVNKNSWGAAGHSPPGKLWTDSWKRPPKRSPKNCKRPRKGIFQKRCDHARVSRSKMK